MAPTYQKPQFYDLNVVLCLSFVSSDIDLLNTNFSVNIKVMLKRKRDIGIDCLSYVHI